MPNLKVSCFCANGSADLDWCALPNCGHIFHIECIEQWLKSRQKEKHSLDCPQCRAPFKAAKPDRKKLKFMKLVVTDIESDPASQATQDSHLINHPSAKPRLETLDEIEDSSDEEEDNSVQKLEKQKQLLRRQHNELLASHREVVKNLKLAQDVVTRQEKEILELSTERDELLIKHENDEELTAHQALEIESLKEEIEQLGIGQPNLRLDITELEKSLLDLQTVLDIATDDLKEAREHSAELMKKHEVREEKWKSKESKFLRDKQKMVDKLNQEGNEGAIRNTRLSEEIKTLNTRNEAYKKQVAAAYNSLQAKLDETIADRQSKVLSAENALDIAESKRVAAEATTIHLQHANRNWEDKYNKLKAKRSERRPSVIVSSPDDKPHRSARIPLPRPISPSTFQEVPLYRINNSAAVPTTKDDPFDDEEDFQIDYDYKDRFSPKKPRLATLIDPLERASGWIRPTKTMREDASDKHLPTFATTSARTGAAPKFGPKFKGIKGERGIGVISQL